MKTILRGIWIFILLASACNYPEAAPTITESNLPTHSPPQEPTYSPAPIPTYFETQPPPTHPVSTQTNSPAPDAPTPASQTVLIYLVALEDDGVSGEKIGCGDSLVPVNITIPGTQGVLRAALTEVLTIQDAYYGESGLYNALYQSDLQVRDIRIENGLATIQLEGTLRLGGVCDNPRLEGQLMRTALQFSTVRAAVITVNGTPLEEILSGK